MVQVEEPVPESEKSLDANPVTASEKTTLYEIDVDFVSVVVGAKVAIDGPSDVICTCP